MRERERGRERERDRERERERDRSEFCLATHTNETLALPTGRNKTSNYMSDILPCAPV